jgi:SAM-dependent methyltransferase
MQEYYEQVYYSYQTKGRGLLDENSLRTSFERLALHYRDLFGPLLPEDKNISCLELGCGYGSFLYFLRKMGYSNVYGVDSDPDQIRLARLLDLNAGIGDALSEIGKASGLGLVAAIDLIEHLDKNTAVLILQEGYRALNYNGMIIIQCPCADGFTGSHDIFNDLTHRWGASSNTLRQLLCTIGFTRVEVVDPGLPMFRRTWRGRFGIWRIIIARKLLVAFLQKIFGISCPHLVWSNSQIAIGWK